MPNQVQERRMTALRDSSHPRCFVCGRNRADGLQLKFHAHEDGGVEARFDCDEVFQGYPQQLHGGIICALLDGAMTNCLFANGQAAVTAELTVRFLRPVKIGRGALVSARALSGGARLVRVEAEMLQDGIAVARATAKFMRRGGASSADRRSANASSAADTRAAAVNNEGERGESM